APLNRSAVRVLVVNAANRTGIASSTADVIIAAGFTDSTPVDALNNAAVSVVYARPGFEAAAAEVAATVGLAATTVRQLDTTAITRDDGSGDVIVLIGVDFPR
ncbi:MAG: LytR C-terminal domain-containing protein, partial [Ilumatobacteraceae bacterium]|nr:LytR C-terminal domain-containing protein [Ilumatobacteraceae bacterium]